MKQTVTIGIVGVIALAVGLLVGSQVLGGSSSAQNVDELQQQISALEQRISELEGRDQVSSLQERMSQLEQQIEEIQSGDSQALADRIAQLESRVDSISTNGNGSTSGGGSPWANVAVVRVDELATRYQEENPEVKQRLQEEVQRLQGEMQSLQQRVQNGELSQSEAQLQATQLQQQLQDLTLEVVAQPIQAAVTAIAQERGYTAVFNVQDTIIYRQEGLMENITSTAWDRLQAASSSGSNGSE